MESGRLWDVFSEQGRRGLWYCGSSVSHESIRGVMEYNKLLLRNMADTTLRIRQKHKKPLRYKNPYPYSNSLFP